MTVRRAASALCPLLVLCATALGAAHAQTVPGSELGGPARLGGLRQFGGADWTSSHFDGGYSVVPSMDRNP